jgi:MFS family permease
MSDAGQRAMKIPALSDPERAERANPFAPFRYQLFRRLWIASLLSNFGGMIQSVGAAWLMTSIAPGAEMVALVQTAVTLPLVLFSLPSGALADIFDRRTLMLVSQVIMFLVSAMLAVLTYLGLTTPAILLASTFLLGSGASLYAPAWQSSIVDQLPPDALDQAVAMNGVNFNIARSLGPAIGGLIVAAAGAAAAFVVNALTYVPLIFTLARWKRPPSERALPPETVGSAIRSGLRYVRLSPALIATLVRGSLFGLCGSAVPALAPVLAKSVLGGGPITYGLLLGGFGLGAVGGAFGRPLLTASRSTLLRHSTIVFAAAPFVLGWSTSLWLSIPAMALAGAAWMISLSGLGVLIQLATPRWVVGRAISMHQMAIFAGMALGSALWGVAARHSGVQPALLMAGGAMAATLLVELRFRLPDVEQLDLSPVRLRPIDDLAGPVASTDGPIMVTIEYRVKPADSEAFLAAVEELGRIRRRDGARRWSIVQDVDNPELWSERFHSATWLDHLRRQVRFTVADAAVRDRVRELHEGEIVVRRMIQRGDGTRVRGTPVVTEPPNPY